MEEGTIKEINYKVQVDIFSFGDYTNIETIIINEMVSVGFEYDPGSPDLYEEKQNYIINP
ncbi:hypothetical protein Q5M85_21325 [Paraclostridium bifermentans]|nr:hypothetical protein [Paraclostridium bifermentans]